MKRLFLAIVVMATAAEPAEAHIVASRLGDFYAGALHPLTDLQDVVMWLAVGVLAGSLGTAPGRWLVVIFPAGLVAGLTLGLATGILSFGLLADAGIMVGLGLLLAAAVRLPGTALWMIAFGLAAMRGMVNAGGVGPENNQLLYTAGLATIGYVAITLTMAVTLAFRRPKGHPENGAAAAWRGIAIRACGSWVAAVGVMLGGFALAS